MNALKITCTLIVIALVCPLAQSRELKDVTLEINTVKKGAEAKQDAFDEAVETATKELAQDILGAEKVEKNWEQMKPKILKNSTKYVVFIKGSAPVEAKGQSKIEVQLRLSPDHLESVLRENGLIGNETVRLLPLVQIADTAGRYSWWADLGDSKTTSPAQGYFKRFFQQLNGQFKGKNVFVLDPTSQSFRAGLPASYRTENLRREDQVMLGQYLNADVVLSGRVEISKVRADSADHKIEYTLQLWQTKTGRTLAEATRTENVASESPKVIQAGMEQVQPGLFTELTSKLHEAVASGNLNLTVVKISVEGNLNPRQMTEFKKLLSGVREIRSLRERLLESQRTTFESESSLSGQELGRAIQKARFPHFSVDVSSSQDDRLVIAVKPTGSS